LKSFRILIKKGCTKVAHQHKEGEMMDEKIKEIEEIKEIEKKWSKSGSLYDRSVTEAQVNIWSLLSYIKELESDALTMALRLYGENPETFGPECRNVMEKWGPRVKAILDAG
jgi:DNA-binding Lrp family transcriptional regulator